MSFPTGILARGPWERGQVAVQWRADSFEPDPAQSAAADRAIAELVERDGNPRDIRVVTSDRELAARVQAAGAEVEGAARFRARLDAL